MKNDLVCKMLCLLFLSFMCSSMYGETWYVRRDGGTRYSAKATKGQCDGTADAAYRGKGTNQHCAFNDVRDLWTDGTYTTSNAQSSFPSYGWVGAGGDTYVIRGSIGDGVSYRVGQNGPNPGDGFGLAGDPFGAGAPPPFSGTANQHTKILGGNYESCHSASARTQLHGGYGVGVVLSMAGVSYVDVACLDITDFAGCGRAAQTHGCKSDFPLDDYAGNGISWSNASTHDTLTDVRIHGLASAGMIGPVGDGMVFSYLDILGNAAAGWNADSGNGTTGSGSLLVEHYQIGWNGCAEEYPISHDVPYQDCTDDESGGYGDGFGTTTIASNPAWNVHFDQGSVFYNTQDGLDALHIGGKGSSMTVTNTLAYGNMGQQIKVGGSTGNVSNSRIVTNCNALRQAIPGTPSGYNSRLKDFCRAADTGVVLTVNDGSTTIFENNILYSASTTAIEVDIASSCSTAMCLMKYQNNIFIGFLNNAANGYPSGGTGGYSNLMYLQDGMKAFSNPGSSFSQNTTYHQSRNWSCPATQLRETRASCGDPHLKDQTWHLYGYGDMTRTGASGATAPAGTGGHASLGPSTGMALKYVGAAFVAAGVYKGIRHLQGRSDNS
jgi:hypothetical protein